MPVPEPRRNRRPTAADRHVVALESGVGLSYYDQGDATGPALLLLPGPTDSWRSYQQVLDMLPLGIRAICVSQRGHGDSDKPDRGYRVEDFAADALALLDALGVGRAFLAGHSGSCFAVRRVALDHPDRVAGLVLEACPTVLGDDATARRFVESVVSELRDPISADFARSFVADTSSEGLSTELVDLLVEEVLKVPARVWKATFAGLLDYDDMAELTSLSSPALLVWGEADALVSRAMQDELVRSIPDAELLVHPWAGHTPRWNDPARFTHDVVAFVHRVHPVASSDGGQPTAR